jgi:transposase
MTSLAHQAQAIADLYQPPKTGRPSDIGSASTVQQFLEAVGEGNYIETAAKLAGLSKQSVYDWLKRGHAGEPAYKAFADAVEKAEARAEAAMVANVRKASHLPQFWAAGMTVLERRHPERWGKRQDDTNTPKVVVQIGGPADVKIGIAVSPPTFAPDSPIEDSAKSLTGNAFAMSSSPITAVMLTPAVSVPTPVSSDRQIPAGESGGGPQPVGGEAHHSSGGRTKQRAQRGGRKKKA